MASSSTGASSGSSTVLKTSSSEEDPQQVMIDQRKRKRMLSNRESARRSRMRKQRHLDDLTAQIAQLGKENSEIIKSMIVTTQLYLNIEAENSVLRAQVTELSQRLDSLNEIINYVNSSNPGILEPDGLNLQDGFYADDDFFMNPWSSFQLINQNQYQPMMDMVMY